MSEDFQVSDSETECTCLSRRQVEEDLSNGVNPLGLDSKQCYQVPSDMFHLYKDKNGSKYKEIIAVLIIIVRYKWHCNSPLPARLHSSV